MTKYAAWEHRVTQRVTLTCEEDDAHRFGTWIVTSEGAKWEQLKHRGKPTTARGPSGAVLLVCQKCRAIKPRAAVGFPERAALDHLVEVMLVSGPAHVTVEATTQAVRAKTEELAARGGRTLHHTSRSDIKTR